MSENNTRADRRYGVAVRMPERLVDPPGCDQTKAGSDKAYLVNFKG